MGRRSKQPAKKQQPITLHALPLLKKPLEQIGKQINVPGSYWEGRMSADERSTLYKCSMRDFTQMHKFPGEQAPRAAFQLQEMGVAGTGSTEQGDSSGEVLWMPYSPTSLARHGGRQQEEVQALRQSNEGALLPNVPRQGRRAVRS